MTSPFARTVALPSGRRVRVRLARPGDRVAVEGLLAARDLPLEEGDLCALLGYDPLTRLVLAAFAPVDGAERLVGIGGIDLDAGAVPDTLVTDHDLAPGVGELLGEILLARAAAHARRAA